MRVVSYEVIERRGRRNWEGPGRSLEGGHRCENLYPYTLNLRYLGVVHGLQNFMDNTVLSR